jgi:hypothetical protein
MTLTSTARDALGAVVGDVVQDAAFAQLDRLGGDIDDHAALADRSA